MATNEQNPTEARNITPPAFDPEDDRPAAERYLDQQWRDADKAGLGERHPLAVNPDTSYA